MPTRWSNIVVVLFWMATMTWLAITKILPPLRVGEPPTYQSVLAHNEFSEPVGWILRLNEDTVGWAASQVVHRPDGMTAVQGRVFLKDLPLENLAPGWLGKLLRPLLSPGSLELVASNRVDIDPLGRLTGFESRLHIASFPDPIRIQGIVEGTQLHLSVSGGEAISYKDDRYLPPGAFVGDELLPQMLLPGLRVGQTWTMPIYSPFRPHKSPMEVLQAEVEEFKRIKWNNEDVNCLLVVYRSDSGSGFTAHREPRGKLWVAPDGQILKQQLTFFNSPLWFYRLVPQKCELISERLGKEWNQELSAVDAQRLLKVLVGTPSR